MYLCVCVCVSMACFLRFPVSPFFLGAAELYTNAGYTQLPEFDEAAASSCLIQPGKDI